MSRDTVWGIGHASSNAEKNRGQWGLNLLGDILEKVRISLRHGVVNVDTIDTEVLHLQETLLEIKPFRTGLRN